MEAPEGDRELECWLFDKTYINAYPMRVGTHRIKVMELEICHRTEVRTQGFVGWHKLEMFTVLSKDRHRRYVAVPAFWQNWEAPCILYVPSPPEFVFRLSAFGSTAKRFGYLLVDTAIKELMTMSIFYSFHATE